MKIYWHDGGHVTKMAAMPIYGKNPSKIFLSGTGRLISTKLGMSQRWLLPIILCSNDDRGLTLWQGQIWLHRLIIYRKKWKLLIFQIFYSLWPETLAQGHLHLKIKTGFSQKWLGHFWTKFYFVCGPNIRWEFHRTIGALVWSLLRKGEQKFV